MYYQDKKSIFTVYCSTRLFYTGMNALSLKTLFLNREAKPFVSYIISIFYQAATKSILISISVKLNVTSVFFI